MMAITSTRFSISRLLVLGVRLMSGGGFSDNAHVIAICICCWSLLLGVITGVICCIASACV